MAACGPVDAVDNDHTDLHEAALAVSTDQEHRFELAVNLKRLDVAHQIAEQMDQPQKWRQLSDMALRDWNLNLALECLRKADDLAGMLLFHSASGNAPGLRQLAASAGTQTCARATRSPGTVSGPAADALVGL